ncbi:O-antigen ligase family protein [Marinobacter adhaerens]|uniref:O-antigen ligase family protein n=1 Tax=Marinobacter adhaerens TaxID=1033846 RepID=UPI001C56B225|nr:O-antigen ligase family protein [Marinobacter adhaerens]MBW3225628.1 O-antigen ligase family protein [Marinobacter adhaerens]
MAKKRLPPKEEDFYALRIGQIWRYFKGETFAFWMVCAYLFFEYVRPQSIYPAIDFLPWTQLTVIGAILGCFVDKSVRWVSSPVNILLVIFFIIILISSFFAYFPEASYKNLDKYYLWLIIYFVIINIVNTKERFFIFICIFLLASFKLSLSLAITWAQRGFSFTDWGLMGPPGFFQNSGELAIQMLIFWPIAWAFVQYVKPYISKLLYLLLLLMPITAIMVILGASSRGAQLALVAQLVVMNYRYIINPKVVVSIFVVLALLWTFVPDEQKGRFETMGEDVTSRQRLLYWENGMKMIQEHPFFGVGYFNFAPYYQRYYPEDLLVQRAQLPHNIFIQVGTDTGIIGLTIFFLLLIVAMRKGNSLRSNKNCPLRLAGTCANLSLLGFLVAGQFVTVTYYPFLWIHLALITSLSNSLENYSKARPRLQV